MFLIFLEVRKKIKTTKKLGSAASLKSLDFNETETIQKGKNTNKREKSWINSFIEISGFQ